VGFMGKFICGLRKQSLLSLNIISSRQLDIKVSDGKFKYVRNFILNTDIRSQADGCDIEKAFFGPLANFLNATVSCVTFFCLSVSPPFIFL
jgi:hypothetical protein